MKPSGHSLRALFAVLFAAVALGDAFAQGITDKPFDMKPFIPPVIPLPPNAQVAPGTSTQTTLPTDTASPIYNPQAQTSSGPGLSITIPTRPR